MSANKVNVYKNQGEWCYAMFVGGELDHNDVLDIDDDATDNEAREEAQRQFENASVHRVYDTNE